MRSERRVNARVYCEGATAAAPMRLNIPDQVNMIYGSELGCEARGVVMIDLLDGAATADPAGNALDTATQVPNAVAVWSHISQMGGGFRMNFAGIEDVTTN